MVRRETSMDAELREALRRMAEGRHPVHDWPIRASHSTLVSYAGITGRKRAVDPESPLCAREFCFREPPLDGKASRLDQLECSAPVAHGLTVLPALLGAPTGLHMRPTFVRSKLLGRRLSFSAAQGSSYVRLHEYLADRARITSRSGLAGACAIGNVVVAPDARAKGVGSYLIETMVRKALLQHRAQEVRISCFNGNVAGLLLYAKLGFVPFAVERRVDQQGARVALIHMKLDTAAMDRYRRS
jgi:GNAT superfamily N-acetyltransferase